MKTLRKTLFAIAVIIFTAQAHAVMYQARPYDPNMGRWLSRDPIGEAGGVNLYGFVGNDAVDDFDALGEKAYMNYRDLNIWFLRLFSNRYLPLSGHVFLSFDEKGFSSSEKKKWGELKTKLGVRAGAAGINTFSFHPESVYIDRRKDEKTLPENFDNRNRLSVLVTRGAFVDVDNQKDDIDQIKHSDRELIARNYCEQARLLKEAVKSAKINNGGTLDGDLGGGTDPGPYSFVHGNCGHWASLIRERAGLNGKNWGERAFNRQTRWNFGIGHGTGLSPVGYGIQHTLEWIFKLGDTVRNPPRAPISIPPPSRPRR